MATHTLAIPKNPACRVCSHTPEAIELTRLASACTPVEDVTPAQVQNNTDAVLIDVREREERNTGYIEGALHCPLSALNAGHIPYLPENSNIILHCQHGIRSIQAGQLLKQKGFANIYSLKGGYAAWAGDD